MEIHSIGIDFVEHLYKLPDGLICTLAQTMPCQYIFPSINEKLITIEPRFKTLLDIDGKYAFIAASTEGLYILDVSNKTRPLVLSHIDTPGNATDVLIDGNIAFVADGSAGVSLIDVSDKRNPKFLSTSNTAGYARKLTLQGRTLFIADGLAGVQILDVVDPNTPYNVTTIDIGEYTWIVDLYGGILVVGTNNGVYSYRVAAGDGITDFSDTFVSSIVTGYDVRDVKVKGDIAYIASGIDGMLSIDISDTMNPVLLDQWSIGTEIYKKIDLSGNIAYLVSSFC